MKRLMLTALMGCMLMGQVKAENTLMPTTNNLLRTAAYGLATPVVAGALVGAGQQLLHVSNMTSGSKFWAFLNGQDTPQMQPNTFFDQHTDIPRLQSRISGWINYFGKCGLTMACGAAAFWIFSNKENFAHVMYGNTIPATREAAFPHLLAIAGSMAIPTLVAANFSR